MGIARVPTLLDAIRTKVDVLGVAFAAELWREQAHDMHPGPAAVARQFASRGASALGLRQARDQLIYDMTQAVKLLLAHNLARDPARILHVLVPIIARSGSFPLTAIPANRSGSHSPRMICSTPAGA